MNCSFDGSGVKGRLAYNISNGLTLGANLSHDEAFDTRFTADIKYRFGSNGYGAPSSKKEWEAPVIKALTEPVKNRDVRVHDKSGDLKGNPCNPQSQDASRHGHHYHCSAFGSSASIFNRGLQWMTSTATFNPTNPK